MITNKIVNKLAIALIKKRLKLEGSIIIDLPIKQKNHINLNLFIKKNKVQIRKNKIVKIYSKNRVYIVQGQW